ncbi:hypothetical protein [Paraburkholderia sp. J12]|uniref:hypothetical protein n=1 Tax=Paraburkholderia sp. J12 TaxID=2805432 RepID=UPI002ABDA9D9|nr:hypothetical protein [Paraburkholderia sp. J12]
MTVFLSWALISVAVVVCLSLLLMAILTGVPSLPSSQSEVKDIVALLKYAALPPRPVIYDFGSGWGTLLIALAKEFPEAQIRGIEISPFPYLVSRLRTYRLRNVSLKWGSFFRSELTVANAIICYLMPGKMARVSALLDQTLTPGTPVVSNTFWFRNRIVARACQASGRGAVALYIWPATGDGGHGLRSPSQ